jgi:hypothetical protein
MSIINHPDLAHLQEDFQERLFAFQEGLCKEIVSRLEGRQVIVKRNLKNAAGGWEPFEVTVTVTDARIGYDNGAILGGTYTHPLTGRIIETEVVP